MSMPSTVYHTSEGAPLFLFDANTKEIIDIPYYLKLMSVEVSKAVPARVWSLFLETETTRYKSATYTARL